MRLSRNPAAWVFVILLASHAYFWQGRDWNSASRLMLTYALVDRGTIALNGLEDQTHDRAFFRGRFYTDKLPGYSLVAAVPYVLAKTAFRLPPHPLGVAGFAHWPADYWVTLGTSGLCTAWIGALLVGLARDLGCGPRKAALVGLAYGLATPAYAYATFAYGHQMAAALLLSSFAILWRHDAPKAALRAGVAGFLASYAAVIELSVGPVAAVLGFYLLGQAVARRRKPSTIGDFAVGALIPLLLLLGYNQLAYGSPFDMGYFHHTTKIFADVHGAGNPLGLRSPELQRITTLLLGRYRGLTFYAPIVWLMPFGIVSLARARLWGMLWASVGTMAVVFAVNLSYPEWTGGWSTGPRLLVPLLPFAMLPVATLLARNGRGAAVVAALLALAGGVVILLFVGVGGRLPQFYTDPLVQAVGPIWLGRSVEGWVGDPFARNVFSWLFPALVARLPNRLGGLQFAPLVLFQIGAIAAMLSWLPRGESDPKTAAKSDLRVDQEQDDGRQQEQADDVGAQLEGVPPDPGP